MLRVFGRAENLHESFFLLLPLRSDLEGWKCRIIVPLGINTAPEG